MPLPPEEAENGENTGNEEPKLQFSYVECLLFSFHQLGKKLPDFLIDKVDAEQLKDFKIRWERLDQCCAAAAFAGTALTLFSHRLQYFARGLQVYIRQLRVALQGKTGDALKTDEVTSQRCCWWLHGWLHFKMFISFGSRTRLKWLLWRSQTISTCSLRWGGVLHTHTPTHTCFETQLWFLCLIQDLFHNPPSFKSTVTLSWKPVQKAEALVYVCLCGSGLTETFRSWRFLLSAEPSVHPLTRWILGPPQRSPFLLSLEGMPGRSTTPPVASTAPPLATSTMVRNALWHRRRHDLLLQVTCSCNIRPLLNTYKMVSFVFLGSIAFICYLGCDITKMVFDFCVQNNVEASGAAEDEVLAPGEVEAGAVSIEPLAAGRMASHQHRLLIFFIFLMFSRPPDPPADYCQGGFWLRLLTLSFTSSSGPIHPDWF